MKQYASFRKKQSIKISDLILQIESLNDELDFKVQNKQSLIKENRDIQRSLLNEKKQSSSLVSQLRKKEKSIKKILNKRKIDSSNR